MVLSGRTHRRRTRAATALTFCQKMSYAKPILDSQHDAFWAYSAIRDIMEGFDLDSMSGPERKIALIDRMTGQVANGGFDQYFLNDGLEFARECRQALAETGMMRMEAVLAKAIELVGGGPYSHDSPIRAELQSLDQEFYRVDQDELYPAAIEYIRRHQNEFGWPDSA